ncbi:glycerate kinase domain protein [Streptococcus pneumoniae 2071247]|nr:glycerate kinase domain protein [Streptococcus pneumoniae 2071247]
MTDPFGQKEAMRYFQKGELALFEVADLVGLGKIPLEKRNPLQIQNLWYWRVDSPSHF